LARGNYDERKTMIDRLSALPLTRQAQEQGISRGSVYYLPRPTSAADLAIMRRIDAFHMDYPFAGSRMLRDLLAAEGIKVGRLHISTLIKKMAIDRGDLPMVEHLEAGSGAQDLPLSAAKAGGDAAQPGVGDRHHVHPDGARLRLSDRDRRSVQPAGAQPALINHAGD
jgi:hypothetical protein